jgi:hypothetical protein
MNRLTSRRRFLYESFAFSALAGLGSSISCSSAHPSQAASLNYLILGDWGYDPPTAQETVAAAMGSYVQQHQFKPDGLLMLGDNWYGDLTGGVDSPRWKTHFEDLYSQSIFDCPAYAVPGNHDYQRMPESKVDIELAYARRGGTRWTMPALWYSLELPTQNPLVTLIGLNSNISHSSAPQTDPVNFTLTSEETDQQLRWLKAEMELARTTPYRIVMAHHPVYSDGPHGDTKALVADWDPLLQEHKVHLYLAGHDHDMQHLEFEGHPTSFVLSGGGGADLHTLPVNDAARGRGPYAAKVHGFSHLQIAEDKLTLLHVDQTGLVIHGFTKTPDGKVSIL